MASQKSEANLLNTNQVKSNHASSKSRKEKSKQKKEAQLKRDSETQVKKELEVKIVQEHVAETEKVPEAQTKQKSDFPLKDLESLLKKPESLIKEPEAQLKEPESPSKKLELPLKEPKEPELPPKKPESPLKEPELPPIKPESPLKEPESSPNEPKSSPKEPEAQIEREPESQLKVLEAQISKEPATLLKQETETMDRSVDEDSEDNDVDLSAIQMASSLLDKTFALDDTEFDLPEGNNEAYKNLMGICSSSTENIKKSIYEILNSREKVDISEEDPATVLQESLNKKMEDFNKVISGCMDSNNTPSTSSQLESIEQTTPDSAEVCLEEKEPSVDDQQLDSNNDSEKVTNEDSEKLPCSNMTVDLNSGEQSTNNTVTTSKGKISKTAKGKSKNTSMNNSNADTGIVATKLDDTPGETNAKTTKVIDKRPDNLMDSPSSNSKPLSSILEARKSEREALRNSISPDDERFARKQRNVAAKKKGEKTYDQILKSLGNGTAEEKLHLLCKKHVEALDEFRLMEPRLKQLERQYLIQQRERESSQAELNRMILAKSRLEGLCREMQRQSRAVKEESLLRIKEEEEKRKEIANKFQATLNDISSLMQENSKKNIQLREENAQLATKLKGLVDNYEIWEQNMTKVVQQKELETQLAKAKHAKVNLLLKQETEKFLREKQALLENLSELQKRCTILTSNELQLRTELSDYTSKYEEFQSVLSNSSKVFSTFKNDMETTSKKIKKLEKETNVYKQKWEGSNKALLDMISHKDKQDKEFSNAQQRILTLEKLCRALQAERNELQNQISVYSSSSVPTNNTDVPPLATEAGVV